MSRLLSTIVALSLLGIESNAQVVTPDLVVLVNFGEMGGRGEEFLPDNVLGPPDTVARETVPSIDPKEILSLGLRGSIVVQFTSALIVDRPGPDFTVFENPFFYALGEVQRVYSEPGIVSVSSDGSNWITFPFDSLSLDGLAGKTPTNGNQAPGDPTVSGGDKFDLATIGADSIRYVMITDASDIILSNKEHPFYDATINGFDLDAVVALHTSNEIGLSDTPETEFFRPGELDLSFLMRREN